MDPLAAATAEQVDAADFVRFCHGRRRVGWPELYDEMCAVAARGLYRGYSADDLEARGIRFGLFDMPALAALTREIVAADAARRRGAPPVVRDVARVVQDVERDSPAVRHEPRLSLAASGA